MIQCKKGGNSDGANFTISFANIINFSGIITINIGDKIAQGIFTKYLIVDDEEEISTERAGGLGSTGK